MLSEKAIKKEYPTNKKIRFIIRKRMVSME